ncbi:sulfur carrier protein ThiS [Tatumella citrea]|uniref:Thiamine biosynthesis protein ThiS n=1 Tax=Tatumella citrea TaxID=53336 RepID=A0A1Y0LPT7_TATCI|nr:sulfur carrier protein ThiS [Tatumella citrea]ARU95527.1 thiamine biosynthesis protein ThiS [Tatumella citrea]ARU99568.1 thiamine biosynthesis protein ThiS [Tatumella citrea]
MQITLNDKLISVSPSCPLSQLLQQLRVRQKGTALAVNGQIIPAAGWPEYLLQENDDVVVFQVIAGG